MNHKTLLTISIISAGCAFSTTTLAGPQWGNAKQQSCIVLEKDAPADLVVETHAYTHDTNNINKNPQLDFEETFTIPKGSIATSKHCAKTIAEDDLKGEARLGWEFKVYLAEEYVPEGQTEPVDQIKGDSYFHGGGQNNKWDLREQGRCNDGRLEPGIHLVVQDSVVLSLRIIRAALENEPCSATVENAINCSKVN